MSLSGKALEISDFLKAFTNEANEMAGAVIVLHRVLVTVFVGFGRVNKRSPDYWPGISTTMKNKKYCCESFVKISAVAWQ